MATIILIAHNVRSCLNVGSLLRTADGLGVTHVYLTGYTPYPMHDHDTRLPHEARKIANRINKSALGAENSVAWSHEDDVARLIGDLHAQGYQIVALEQTATSVPLDSFRATQPVALIVGREVEGVETEVLELCDQAIEIPMRGHKESFNVSIAAAIALYCLSR